MEFTYFGPGTPQYLAGLAAVPAGLIGLVGAAMLWRQRARGFVLAAAISLLAATVAGAVLDVMGPPPIILGAIGSLLPLAVLARRRTI